MSEMLIELLYVVPAALIAIVLHEFAHGWMSSLLGDPTPKQTGRLSLNPLRHLDIVGTLVMIFFHFGWAKPVQVNPNYYKHPKWGMALTALAGPMMNFLLAFLSSLLFGGLLRMDPMIGLTHAQPLFGVLTFLNYFFMLNVGLGAFNLIPLPPLDGSKILGALLPEKWYFSIMKYERYLAIITVALVCFGVFNYPISWVQDWAIVQHNHIVEWIVFG